MLKWLNIVSKHKKLIHYNIAFRNFIISHQGLKSFNTLQVFLELMAVIELGTFWMSCFFIMYFTLNTLLLGSYWKNKFIFIH